VIVPGHVREALKQLHRKEANAGRREQFLSAMRTIAKRLRDDPLRFGEPLYRLPALKLLVCVAASVPPLVVDFGVHQTRPLVIIRGVRGTSPE